MAICSTIALTGLRHADQRTFLAAKAPGADKLTRSSSVATVPLIFMIADCSSDRYLSLG